MRKASGGTRKARHIARALSLQLTLIFAVLSIAAPAQAQTRVPSTRTAISQTFQLVNEIQLPPNPCTFIRFAGSLTQLPPGPCAPR